MNLKYALAIIGFLTTSLIYCQNKQITLEEIWSGTFRTEGMQALHSMKNGKQYSILNFDRQTRNSTIDIYNYKDIRPSFQFPEFFTILFFIGALITLFLSIFCLKNIRWVQRC